jgi:hypothetical protein
MQKKHLLVLLVSLLFQTARLQAQTPPATWQEHWFEHVQLLNRVYYDNDLALYYDKDVNTSVTWTRQFLGDIWRYTKKTYGSFGSDSHMYAVLHTGKYSGGHPSTYFDASHDNRNVIDAGAGPWTTVNSGDNLLTHEVGHLVELAGKNMHGSPAFGIWGDSKWAEIYIYDVYKNGLNLSTRAAEVYTQYMNTRDNFPRENTAWFRDWFYPIYSNHGEAKVLNRYFVLLSLYFARTGTDYPRMNMGEFVHFWSAAVGVNLRSRATLAFGWTDTYEAQFIAAQAKYPMAYAKQAEVASLFEDSNYNGYGIYLPVGRYTLAQLKAYGGRNDDISSLKIASGYKATLYLDDNFSGGSLTVTGNIPLLDVATWNDKLSSIVIAPVAAATEAITEHEETTGITVYPNPVITGGTLTVSVDKYDPSSPVQVQLVDVSQKVALYKKENAQRVSVATGKLASGFYVLVVKNGSGYFKKKILIQ